MQHLVFLAKMEAQIVCRENLAYNCQISKMPKFLLGFHYTICITDLEPWCNVLNICTVHDANI